MKLALVKKPKNNAKSDKKLKPLELSITSMKKYKFQQNSELQINNEKSFFIYNKNGTTFAFTYWMDSPFKQTSNGIEECKYNDKYNINSDWSRSSEFCWFISQIKQTNYISSDTILNLSTLPLKVSILCLNADKIDFNQDVSFS